MAKLNVLEFPDERLKIKAPAVQRFDRELACFANDLFETMYYERGIGLAATQVGSTRRLMVVDVSENKQEPQCFINPCITHREGTTTMQEGCLSVPNFTADVKRAAEIILTAQDVNGQSFTVVADGLLSVCLQHEIDHLNGKLFIDRLSPLRLARFLDALRKIKKNETKPKRRTEARRLAYLKQWKTTARRKDDDDDAHNRGATLP